MPACELEVGVYCNRPRDHKLLGWLCAELATQFDGMIDLDGSLPFPDRQDWHRSGLVGTVLDIEYETDSAEHASCKSSMLHSYARGSCSQIST